MLDYKTLAAELGLGDEDKTALFGLFEKNPTVVGKLESFLETQVTTRLTPLQTELATKQRELDAQFDTLASIRSGDENAVRAAEARIEKLSGQAAVLTERLRTVATNAGLNADDLLRDVAAEVRPKEKPVPEFDPAKLMAEASQSAWVGMQNTALLEDLAAEHQTLFGKPMSRVKFLNTFQETVKRTGNTNLGLRDVFETTFNVAGKRSEMAESEIQRRIKDAEKATETRLRDEYALRASQGGQNQDIAAPRSPLLAALPQESPAHVGGLPPAVVASIADYRKRIAERKAS